MNGDKLRAAFLNFFKDKGHVIRSSAPLVPEDDPTLLWINAGMAPFKPYFSGELTPPDTRIVSSQKCIRTNDIENVGKTARHHTFFEMLGNFSFGDYFKEKAIIWAWEFVTEVIELEEDRLWITIYEEDEEAFDIWNNKVGVSEDRIIRMGMDENYWKIGTGPCGPCSELHYDRGREYGDSDEDVVGGEGDRYLEIWNLVFTQYDYTEDGKYLPLPQKNIDTGMGLERVASILQDVETNFETDFFKPIIDYVQKETGIEYKKNEDITMSYRVIADHIRGITMAILDGVLPSNEGRGYVIRRLLRRAVRFGGKLGFEKPFLYKLVPIVNKIMSGAYPDLKEKEEHIQKIVIAEEERFFQTLDQGLEILKEMMNSLKNKQQKILSGKNAFKLYDTYGFPLDLTKDVLTESGFKVDEDGFEKEMKKQKQRAREARDDKGFHREEKDRVYINMKDEIERTDFTGYRNYEVETDIRVILKDGEKVDSLAAGETGEILLKRTPFYAESGGQVGDTGILKSDGKLAQIIDTYKKSELTVHQVKVEKGEIKQGEIIKACVFKCRRKATSRNHSCTHLLHRALKTIIGEHVNQSGSMVSPEKLRFDFSHYEALTDEELEKIESRVNKKIIDNLAVETLETTLEKAKDMGATALFNEKYGDQVRVVKMGDYTIELCGGTHVSFTGEIGLFKILSENGVAAGTRRIEAVTGLKALEYVRNKEQTIINISQTLNTNPEDIKGKVKQLLDNQKQLKKEIASLKDQLNNFKTETLINKIEKVNGVSLLRAEVKDLDNKALRNLADKLHDEMGTGIIVLASNLGDKVIFVSKISDSLVKDGYHAGDLIGEVAKIAGGGGGGRPDMAQAGGSRTDKISEALNQIPQILSQQI